MIESTPTIAEELFVEKLSYIVKEFKVPISQVSAWLGFTRATLYNVRSRKWIPANSWYRKHLKRLETIQDFLTQYRTYERYLNDGDYKFDKATHARWTLLVWEGKAPNYAPINRPHDIAQPTLPPTKEDLIQQKLLSVLDKM